MNGTLAKPVQERLQTDDEARQGYRKTRLCDWGISCAELFVREIP